MDRMIYFDNAATTFPKAECVYEKMDEANRNYAVNAGRGSYALAEKAANMIRDVRKQILKLADASQVAEVVLTSSATLACNQIFGGINWDNIKTVYVSAFEHNAVMRTIHSFQQKFGFEVEELAIDSKIMELDIDKIGFQFVRKKPDMVIMTHVSNVTGYILPIQEVAKLAKEYDAITVVDGAQALGLVPVSLKRTPVDFYIFAGHKTLYGPFGVGGFIQSCNLKLNPFLKGGTGSASLQLEMPGSDSLLTKQENLMFDAGGYEPGSPNIVALAGLHASLEEILALQEKEGNPAYLLEKEQELSKYLICNLEAISGVSIYVPQNYENGSHVGIVSFNVDGYQAADIGMILDEDYHIAVRTGYQCAPLIHKHLEVFDFAGVVRASLGRYTTKEEIDSLVAAVREIVEG